MSIQMKDVLTSILYKTNESCMLCFSSLQPDNFTRMSDEILYNDTENAKELLEMLKAVLGRDLVENAATYEDSICDSCLQLTINAFKFIEACKWNLSIMNDLIDNLTTSIIEIEEPETCKTAFLLVNPNNSTQTYLETKTTFANVKKALYRFKTLLKNSAKGSEKEFVCKLCYKEFTTYLEAEKHCELCPGPARFNCNICSISFIKKANLERHCQTIHSGDAIQTELEKACTIIRHNDLIKYQCKHCLTQFLKFSALQLHCKKIHGMIIENSIQEIGNQTYGNIDNEESDVEVVKDFNMSYVTLSQNDINAYQCSQCMVMFTEYHSLQQHCNQIHKQITIKLPADEGILCSICGKTFKNKSLLKRHEEMHVGKIVKLPSLTGIVCSTCGKTFKHKSLLKIHEQTHIRKQITCSICNKVYRRIAYYKHHICNPSNERNIHDKRIECDYCGKKFSNKAGVRNHIRYWHLSNGYFCVICNKRCANQASLREHLLVHTKEKNFECTMCGRKFGVKSALKTHMRIHTGETPYPCEVCGMKFLSSSRRSDHFRSQHSEPTKSCDICSKKFLRPQRLEQHRQTHFKCKNIVYATTDQGENEF